jgi:hypothetical protein
MLIKPFLSLQARPLVLQLQNDLSERFSVKQTHEPYFRIVACDPFAGIEIIDYYL